MKLICKLFNFILNLFTSAVEGIAFALRTVGEIALELLVDAAEAVGNALGIDGTTVLWLGVGVLAFFLLRNKDKDNKVNPQLLASRGVANV